MINISKKKNSFFIICKNNTINPNLEIVLKLLKEYKIIKISIPLSTKQKIIYSIPYVFLYPIFKFSITQVYIYIQHKIRNCSYIIGYSVIPNKIQSLCKVVRDIKTIQIQSGFLGEEISKNKIHKGTKLKYIDYFFGMSKYQSNIAKEIFARNIKTVGLLSTEDWILKNQITCDLKNYEYDICMILNTNNCANIKYTISLIINYILKVKSLKVILASKAKSKLNNLNEYCILNHGFDILNNKNFQIQKFIRDETTTLNSALKSKIILGVKSTVLYQLGSLGMIIHPIDKYHNTDVMSGNLNQLAINLYPSQTQFNDFISYFLIRQNRATYFENNLKQLMALDNTLQLDNLPSKNIKSQLDKLISLPKADNFAIKKINQ